MKKFFLAVVLLASLLLCSCGSEADKANYNISKQADYFESERKITVYNARTDTIILEAEGYMSISNNSNNELVCTVKIGPDTYRKNYIYLNDYTCMSWRISRARTLTRTTTNFISTPTFFRRSKRSHKFWKAAARCGGCLLYEHGTGPARFKPGSAHRQKK